MDRNEGWLTKACIYPIVFRFAKIYIGSDARENGKFDRRKTKNSKEIIIYERRLFIYTANYRSFPRGDGTRPRSRSTRSKRKEVKRRDRVRKQRSERWEEEQKSEVGKGGGKGETGGRRRRSGGSAGSSGMEIYRFCEEESGSTSGCTCPPGCTCVSPLPPPLPYICIPM